MDFGFGYFVLFGLLAQLVDGAFGMGYGASSTSLLLFLGIPPVTASASVHAAEVFTTAVSGASHWRVGNVDWKLVRVLAIPGVIGAVVGAYLLTATPGDVIKPWIAIYLAIMGATILFKAFRRHPANKENIKHGGILGLVGGFCDAVGGGGWGAIVTSTLMARGNNPRTTIGSVNLVEFFVTLSQSIVFVLTIGLTHWKMIVGLLLGGVIAAPLAAIFARRVQPRLLMGLVGTVIILLSIRTVNLAWFK